MVRQWKNLARVVLVDTKGCEPLGRIQSTYSDVCWQANCHNFSMYIFFMIPLLHFFNLLIFRCWPSSMLPTTLVTRPWYKIIRNTWTLEYFSKNHFWCWILSTIIISDNHQHIGLVQFFIQIIQNLDSRLSR